MMEFDLYFNLKPILFSAAFLAAVGIFAYRIYYRVLLMKNVSGEIKTKPYQQIADRIIILFTDILGQKNVRRKPFAGWAHMGLFLGFLAVAPHTTEMFLKGIFPSISLAHLSPLLYGGYLFIADIFAVFVLIGVFYGLFRRLIIKPKYLTNTPSAILILLAISIIIITYFSLNGIYALQIGIANPENFIHYTIISQFVANLISSSSLGYLGYGGYGGYGLNVADPRLVFAFETSYWIHVLSVLGFLAYIPGSKHLHILTAAINVFLRPLGKEKAILKTDLENTEATSFGLAKVSELNWKNVLDLYSCTQCGRCEEQCPAAGTKKPLSPKALITDLKNELLSQGDYILERKNKKRSEVPSLTRNGQPTSPISDEVLWSCTTCKACENICPVNISHLDVITEARKNLVLMEARFPEEMQGTFQNLENQSNPWGFGQDTRGDWCKDLNLKTFSQSPDSKYLFYAGCFGSFEERGIKIARATVNLLKKANVDFAILAEEETCCGDPARRAGNEYLAQAQINQCITTFGQYNIKKIITICPHCLNSIKNEYPDFNGKFEVIHHSQFLLDLVKSKKLNINSNLDINNSSHTFHDSCYLTRWNSILDEPRELLKSVPGMNLIEMPRKKDTGFCCGAGGARMFMEDKVGERINHQRALEAINTNAKTVVSGCPFCHTMLSDAMKERGLSMNVKDVSEVLEPLCIN